MSGSVEMRCAPSTTSRDEHSVIIRWMPTQADRARALKTHGQTLERLQQRGGVAWSEMCAILEDREFQAMDADAARRAVHAILVDRARMAEQASHNGVTK